MPVEILELVVRATVSAGQPASQSGNAQGQNNQGNQRAQTEELQKTVKTVLEIVKRKKER